jgi:hypothetical protein
MSEPVFEIINLSTPRDKIRTPYVITPLWWVD